MAVETVVTRIQPSMLQEHWGAVTGTEHELGTVDSKGGTSFNAARLPDSEFVTNGARVYEDVGHPEMSTAEASNPLQLVAVERALGLRMLQLKLGATLYKNCVDFRGGVDVNHTFAAHENYYTRASRRSLDALIPFFVSRTIFTGAGDTSHGGNDLHLSQRAPFIVTLRGAQTLGNRPLLNERDEPLSSVPGWYRLHLIQGDANMCQVAGLLKHGTTMLVLRLLENGALDPLPYDEGRAISDLHAINRLNSGWELKGTRPHPMKAVDVQGHFLNQVASKLPDVTPLERVVIDLWGEVLHTLETDPMQAAGAVDWVTKAYLFEWLRSESEKSVSSGLIQSQDLEYHNIDPKGIFTYLETSGIAYSIVPEEAVQRYISNPPETTRAWLRGNAVRLSDEASKRSGNSVAIGPDWDNLYFYVNGHYRDDLTIAMPDPREPYQEKLQALRSKLGI